MVIALKVIPIHFGGTAVNDGLFPGVELVAAHQLFAQRQQKLGFQHHRVLSISIALRHVHGIDVIVGGGGNAHHLTAQRFHQSTALGLRINNQDIVIGRQRQLDHLTLGAERLA